VARVLRISVKTEEPKDPSTDHFAVMIAKFSKSQVCHSEEWRQDATPKNLLQWGETLRSQQTLTHIVPTLAPGASAGVSFGRVT